MSYELRPVLTPKRRAWLERLARSPGSVRDSSTVGNACFKLGWTEWCEDYRGERLTDAGWLVLETPQSDGGVLAGTNRTTTGAIGMP